MAAQTIGSWTTQTVGIKKRWMVATCECTTDTTNEILFTKRTGEWLDPKKPWTLIIAASAAQDGAAAPVSLYVGYAEDFALAGTTDRATVTSGARYANITDDIGYAGAVTGVAFQMTPSSSGLANIVTIVAIATGFRFNVPAAPYYAFELYAADAATLLAHTLTFKIIQEK